MLTSCLVPSSRQQCDGKDYTEVIRRKGLEAVAFLNIYSYAAGTRPWGTKSAVDNFKPPRMDDGLIEVKHLSENISCSAFLALASCSPLTLLASLQTKVVGFESALALAKGVMRVGHAYRICQCSSAELKLLQPLPIQVCDLVSIYVSLTDNFHLPAPSAYCLSFI